MASLYERRHGDVSRHGCPWPNGPAASGGFFRCLLFGSLEAGGNNALAYTLLADCRIKGLDPEDYLGEVLRRLPSNATCEQAAALTPKAIAAERRAATEAGDGQVA